MAPRGPGLLPRLVVNLGREVGRNLEAVCGAIEKDSTYGSMHRFLFGVNADPCVRIVDREKRLLEVAGVPVNVLQTARNPNDIGWRLHDVRLVVDTTGAFDDPTRPVDHPGGSLRGHLSAGCGDRREQRRLQDQGQDPLPPDDVTTLIYGCNHEPFDARYTGSSRQPPAPPPRSPTWSSRCSITSTARR